MTAILGGMSPPEFLRDHWQKKPLLIRQAIPGFAGLVSPDEFLALATRDDATSRLILQHPRRKQRWERHDGPFGGLSAAMLPKSHWTLLVHGVESLVPGGWELLKEFAFIPAARVDDLMVSYASDGGGVGPHDDLYDVFLLQGPGKRRWQISRQKDKRLDPGAAIKVLADFRGEEEWLLEPGDMLYLPPGVPHFGVAEGSCFTYSIGFLAPSRRTLMAEFLAYLSATLPDRFPDDIYRDPDLASQKQPSAISDAMLGQVGELLASIEWNEPDIEEFLGRFLTRPKPHVVFHALSRPMVAERLLGKRVVLALPSRGLVRGTSVFLNGERHAVPRKSLAVFHQLFAERAVVLPGQLDEVSLAVLHEAAQAGQLLVGSPR